jgi:hypothetical protein
MEMWHFKFTIHLFGCVVMVPLSQPWESPKPIELVMHPLNINIKYQSFPMIWLRGPIDSWDVALSSSKFVLFGCVVMAPLSQPWESPKPIELVTCSFKIIVEYQRLPMIPHSTQGSYLRWRCGTFNFKICFVWLCCHGTIVSTLRVSKAHWIGDLPSQHKSSLPEVSNDNSFNLGVLLAVEMWHFQVQISFLFGYLVVVTSLKPNDTLKWANKACGSTNHSYTKYSMSNHCQRATKWGVVGQMLKLWEDMWVTETENQIWQSHELTTIFAKSIISMETYTCN